MKKLFAIIMSMLMIACFMPTMAFAATTENCTVESCDHVAAIGSTHYDTLQEAVNAVSTVETKTIILLSNLQSVGDIYLPAGVTLDGGGKKISGDSAVHVNQKGGTVENVIFENIHNEQNKRSPLYAKNLEGELVVTGCTFDTCDWDAIQAIPLKDSIIQITGNTFKNTGEQGVHTNRYVHVQSAQNVDFTVTVTGNKFYDGQKLKNTGLEVYYPVDASKVNLSHNYMAEPMRVCIGTGGTSYDNAAEKAYPFVAEDMTTEIEIVAQMIDYDGNVKLYTREADVAQDGAVAIVAAKGYKSLGEAFAAAGNATIKLLSDVQLSAPIDIEKNITVDLNDKTISAADNFAGGDYILGVKRGGELTINDSGENGKINSNSKAMCGIKLTLKGEAETGTNACLNINGGIIIGEKYGISGNGLRQDTVINFNGGTVKASDSVNGIAIYQPQRGTLTITDGNIEANTALVVKSGILAISGGNIKATGDAKEFNHNGDGFHNTGDALVVEACDYPGGLPVVVSISGGTFTSAKANAVAYYKQNDEYDIVNKKFITGGTFSSDPSAYVADNYVAVKSGDTWTVKAKSTSGGGGFVVIPTETPLDKAKTEANTAVSAAASANKYDDAEQAEVKKILDKAAADIKNAKTEEEVKAIQEAAQAEIDKVLTTEEKAQIKAVKGVDKEIFKAKSKYSKLRGKRAIKVTWNVPNGMKFDGFEIYRSTKKFSGYGKTPYFTTTKTSYINNKGLVKGKTYYYKVRAFVIINGEKVYTDYSTKAFRIIK